MVLIETAGKNEVDQPTNHRARYTDLRGQPFNTKGKTMGEIFIICGVFTDGFIWRNLYEFPLIETERAVTWEELSGMVVFQELFDGIENIEIVREYVAKKHVLSHRVIFPVFYEIRIDSFSRSMGKYLKVPDDRVGEYAVSRLIQSYLEVRDGLLF